MTLSSFAPDHHVVRVTFWNGSSAAKPLVASPAAEKGILVSVLSADTRDLSAASATAPCCSSRPLTWTKQNIRVAHEGTFSAHYGWSEVTGERPLQIMALPSGRPSMTLLLHRVLLWSSARRCVLLVAGDKDGILPLPGWLMHPLNIIINIPRSVPS